MLPLSSEDRYLLLTLARRALLEAVLQERIADFPEPSRTLAEPRAAFVTLHLRGRLRGCIGRVEPPDSLAHTVMQSAIGAALHDPRFAPVESNEVAELE